MANGQQSGFDVNAARQAGYSDDEILSHLTQTRNFDVNSALSAGYSKAEIINHLSASPAEQDFSQNPPAGGSLPVPAELQRGMVLTHRGPMKYTDAIRSQEAGIQEEAMGFGVPASEMLKQAAQPVALGAATAAPIFTAGASLPVQSAIGALSGAGQSKLQGGSNKEAGFSAALGATLPFLGSVLSKAASRFNPSALKTSASAAFDTASQAAGSNVVDVESAGNAALSAQDLQQVGRTMPRVMQRFLQRVTAPDAAPLTYDEARRFYSAAGELSANEQASYTPAMKRALNQFRNQLGQAIQQTANNAGVGTEYGKAMGQYSQAKRLEDTWETVWAATRKNLIPGIVKGLGFGAASGATAYGVYRSLSK